MTTEGTLIAGRYRLVQPIGRGRNGFVWIAQDGLLHRTVAAKQIPVPRAISPAMAHQARAYAAQQARRAATFKHGGAVTVYDVLEDGEILWQVMEYVPGRTMADFMVGHGQLTSEQAASLGAQLATTLAAAHQQSLIHAALEPAVVHLADDGGVQLTDFGVGGSAQNPAYRSPEVIRGEAATSVSDVFSLGATIYLAAEGAVPFGPNGTDIGPPLASGTDDLRHVLLRMLSANPALRPTMAGVAEALTAVAEGRKPSPHSLATALPLTEAATSAGHEPDAPAGPAGPDAPAVPAVQSAAEEPTAPAVPAVDAQDAAEPPEDAPDTPEDEPTVQATPAAQADPNAAAQTPASTPPSPPSTPTPAPSTPAPPAPPQPEPAVPPAWAAPPVAARLETGQDGPFTSPIPVQSAPEAPATEQSAWPAMAIAGFAQPAAAARSQPAAKYAGVERILIITMAVIIAALAGILFTELILL